MKRVSKIKLFTLLILAAILFSPISACQRAAQSSREINEERDEKNGARSDEAEDQKANRSDSKADTDDKDTGNSDYLVRVSDNTGFGPLYGYADSKGRIIIQPQFKYAGPFYDCGIAIISGNDDKMGLIDKKGGFIAEPRFDYFYHSDEIFLGYDQQDDTTHAFDEKGNKVFEIPNYINPFREGLSPYYGNDGNNGFIDKTGRIAIEVYSGIPSPFINGVAMIYEQYGGPSFYINSEGLDMTNELSSGLRVYKDETTQLFGYTTIHGEEVIEARFTEAEPFLNGYAIVNAFREQYGNWYGVIDTEGNYVLEPEYCGILRMGNGLVAVGSKYNPEKDGWSNYFEFCKKAVFTPDFKKHTDWIYDSVTDFDNDYICVSGQETISFLGKDLRAGADMPVFKGLGSFEKDGRLLRGTLNNLETVTDLKGNILVRDDRINLGNGIEAAIEFKVPDARTVLAYPVISGMKDKKMQDTVNRLIVEEMVETYEEELSLAEYDEVFNSYFNVTRVKDLLLIDQLIYRYALGGIHPNHFRNTAYIDLVKGKIYGLNDLLIPDKAYDFLSEKVSARMKETMEEVGYWDDHADVHPDSCFALTQEGLVIYFGEYEIAAYAYGMPEFLIPYSELKPYINTEGDFWKSFNQ